MKEMQTYLHKLVKKKIIMNFDGVTLDVKLRS